MAKPRKLKTVSHRLTEILAIEELEATGGDEYNIEAMSPDTAVPVCIECKGPTANNGRFTSKLLDVVQIGEKKQFVRLHYRFYKYRCLSENCNTVFQKPVAFVNENAKITKRYEDEIIRHVLYESIDKARKDLEEYIVRGNRRDLISKPAISKLIKRWVDERDTKRKFVTQAVIRLYSFCFSHNNYIIACSEDSGQKETNIIEVIPSISESGIKEFFSKIEVDALYAVVVDCNPVVYMSVKSMLPSKVRILVDTDSLCRVLRDEFKEYINERLKRYQKHIRETFVKDPVKLDNEDLACLRRLQKKDAELKSAYNSYSQLYSILKNQRDIIETRDWMNSLGEEAGIYILTTSYLSEYMKELTGFQSVINEDHNYDFIYEIARKIEQYFPISTDEIFRARILYSDFDRKEEKQWKGTSVSRLTGLVDDMIRIGGLKKHER